jgi:hypothetical protein
MTIEDTYDKVERTREGTYSKQTTKKEDNGTKGMIREGQRRMVTDFVARHTVVEMSVVDDCATNFGHY